MYGGEIGENTENQETPTSLKTSRVEEDGKRGLDQISWALVTQMFL